ncbi:MAG: helix-turn-helix domain-containing protein [Lachnospiraceae bacterium]|nr:helix-turn-helix domain-containing protein [Lachnospiraceae bacterium]
MALDSKSVGKKIRDFRKMNHMTQVKFSERMHMTQQTLSRYETGRNPVPTDVLENIAREFSIPFSFFLGINTEDFSEDELCLVEYYRNVDERLKERILDLVRIMAVDFDKKSES